MSALPSPGDAARPVLPAKLRELADLLHPDYPGMTVVLVGLVDGREVMRLPCPVRPPDIAADSLAGELLKALDEADQPITMREWSVRATGGAPTGAVKRRARELVNSGLVTEFPTEPRTYERSQ